MTHIVQDLLTLSRLDSGRDDLKLGRFSFEAALQDLYNAVYMEAQRHAHTLKLELESELPAIVADRERVLQVMMNIVSNSIKYTPDGGHITISAGRTEDRVWMVVDDDGIGIPPEDRSRILSRSTGWTRPVPPVRRDRIGAVYCKEIVNRHQGLLELQDKDGPGLALRLELKIEGPDHG